MKGVRPESRFSFFGVWLSSKRFSLLCGFVFAPLPKISWLYLRGSISGLSILESPEIFRSISVSTSGLFYALGLFVCSFVSTTLS